MRVKRIESAVEARNMVIETGLQMLIASARARPEQPGFQIGKDQMDDRQKFFSDLRTADRARAATRCKTTVSTPVIGDDCGVRRNDAFNKTTE